jgi:putrescine transport system substrate-binding protein
METLMQRTLFLIALAALLPQPASAADTVRIFNWSDYIGETTLADFTKATGLQTVYDVFDSNEILETKVLTGGSGYDVVVPSDHPFLARQVKAGAYMPLDRSKIPNHANLDPDLMAKLEEADPGNTHGVIYQWGTSGFGYNADKIRERMPDAPLDSWDMIFDPAVVSKFTDCGVTILDSPSEIIPLAMHYLGLPAYSESREDLDKAIALLKSIHPYITRYDSSGYIAALAQGDTCLAVGFSGDVLQAKGRAEEAGNGIVVEYVIPREGAMLWFDVMAIPIDAPNPDGAHAFINFVLEPEVMADITNYVAYANAVPASKPFVDEAIRDNPLIFPPPDVMMRLFPAQSIADRALRSWNRAFTGVKTGS